MIEIYIHLPKPLSKRKRERTETSKRHITTQLSFDIDMQEGRNTQIIIIFLTLLLIPYFG